MKKILRMLIMEINRVFHKSKLYQNPTYVDDTDDTAKTELLSDII